MFVVRSPTLDRFFPVFYTLHRRLNADLYRCIFREFFKIFGLPGTTGGFSGVSIDFSDAILKGYALAALELKGVIDATVDSLDGLDEDVKGALGVVRACEFHFKKNLLEFLRSSGTDDNLQVKVFAQANRMLESAVEVGMSGKAFKTAEEAFFASLRRLDGYDDWCSWWVHGSNGQHWRCLFDVGPETDRAALHSTTNASESQNRVVKFDHELVRVSQDALELLMKMQDEKDNQYQLALRGNRPSGPRKSVGSRDPAAAKVTKFAKQRGKRKEWDQGPPKTPGQYKAANKPKSSSTYKALVSKSFPLWKWKANSCAFDAVLFALFSAVRIIPASLSSRVALDARPHHHTRAVAHSKSALRSLVPVVIERLGSVWGTNGDDVENELGCIRDDFRQHAASAAGMSKKDGMGAFASAASILYQVVNAYHLGEADALLGCTGREALQVADMVGIKSLEECMTRQVDERALFLFFEFIVWGDRVRVAGLAKLDDVRVPLNLTIGDMEFRFAACIDYNGSHFRSHLISGPGLTMQMKRATLLPGVYLADPFSKRRAERTGDVPTTDGELKAVLPKFRGSGFVPTIFLYARVK